MSHKTPDQKNKDELKEANYRLNRLMSKLDVSTAFDDEDRYENACYEVGRLQGFEQGISQIETIARS